MSRQRLGSAALAILVGLVALLAAQPAAACSVCAGGDPSSAMNEGVRAGMLVLLGTVGVVLTLLSALMIFWMRRAAQLRQDAQRA